MQSAIHNKKIISREFVDYVHEGIHRNNTNHPFILISRIAGIPKVKKEFIFIEEFRKMKNKILVIAGEYDPIVDFEQLKTNVCLNPNAKMKVFRNVGHVPSIELSDLFNKTTKKFLLE